MKKGRLRNPQIVCQIHRTDRIQGGGLPPLILPSVPDVGWFTYYYGRRHEADASCWEAFLLLAFAMCVRPLVAKSRSSSLLPSPGFLVINHICEMTWLRSDPPWAHPMSILSLIQLPLGQVVVSLQQERSPVTLEACLSPFWGQS